MTADLRNGVLLLQNPYQSPQGILLSLGTSVGGLSPTVQTALVSNADAVLIEPAGVGTDPIQGSGAADVSILADVEMITYHRHSPFPMAAEEVFLGEIGIDTGGGAVDDERSYPTQAVTPSAPAIAEATAMMIFRMIFQVFFFLSLFISMFMFFSVLGRCIDRMHPRFINLLLVPQRKHPLLPAPSRSSSLPR